ncbi:CaiB/BaiF CoA transferase family protein [Haloechinothrix salitolerans]|uniref:CaiB/BaiF CoA transferase family protein n=1 Tax=Haloechinothrix salitolerans TaxID=926830 RepID=A0ABW2BYH7_9PSEU
MGPLHGLRVIEIASIGPGPFAAMLLADMGADVLRLERPAPPSDDLAAGRWNVLNRGRPSVSVDLKNEAGRLLVARLAESSDVLIEGFRPGVMERLGLGPDELLARNESLCYARMTGYGQSGPLSSRAGHDINYISIAGVLGSIARRGERPMFPLNLVGDFGGGGMLLAFGVLCAVLEMRTSGRGQVVDAAMVDGAALLSANIHALRSAGMWKAEPGTNLLDGGAHFYEVYETACGGHIAVGPLEPQFYVELCRIAGFDVAQLPQWDRERWPELKEQLAAVFRQRTRDEWVEIAEHADACLTPVLGLDEAPEHPHNRARGTFITVDDVMQPAPAPRLSRTPGEIRRPPADPGADTDWALTEWGVTDQELADLHRAGAFGRLFDEAGGEGGDNKGNDERNGVQP